MISGLIGCRGAFCAAGDTYYPLILGSSSLLSSSSRFPSSLHFNIYLSIFFLQQIFKQPANGHCALRAGSYPYIVNGSFAVLVYFFNHFVYFLSSCFEALS